MRWSRKLQAMAAAALALGATMLLWPADAEKQLAVYTPQVSFNIDVHDRQGQPYVFLTDLLDPVGATNLRSSGKDWKVQVNNLEAAFSEGQEKATVAGRQFDLGGAWRRLKNHLHGPPANNPKLINYLAAGSIQGLRPMRYEKRVARNRVIGLTLILVVVLWGIAAFLWRHR